MTAPTTVGATGGHTDHDVMSFGRNDPPITIEQMLDLDKLITLDQGREVLRQTEPLAYVSFETGDKVRFRVEDGWNNDLSNVDGNTQVGAFVTFQDGLETPVEYQLTLDGLQQAASQFGYGRGLLERSPGILTEDHLNWNFRSGMDKKLKLMVVGADQIGSAFVRESIEPFSNLAFLETAIAQIEARWPGSSVYVDRDKLAHSLRQTHLQLILPEVSRLITDTGEVDDRWWGGVQISNALDGSTQTDISAFLFRQRCTNGMIERLGDAGSWSRKSGGQDQDAVMAWAETAINEALGSFDGVFDRVQDMVGLQVDPDNMSNTARDLFAQYRIPVSAQRRIMENLVENDMMNMYGLTNAVTAAANGAVGHAEQQRLMATGGDVVRHAERCDGCHRMLPDGIDAPHAH